jgi:hypothetical protein
MPSLDIFKGNGMKFWLCVLLVGALSTTLMAAETCPHSGWQRGNWSRLAAQPCREKLSQRPVKILSPDRKRALLVKEDKVFEISLSGGAPEELFAYRPGDEFLWSPDSNNVLVSFCFGAAGPCGVGATVDGGDAITEIVRKQFASGHEGDSCLADANIGVLTWGRNLDEIIVIAEVPPSPQCVGHAEGYFESFEVSLSQRKVLARHNMQDTIHRWQSILGSGLKNDIKLVKDDARIQHK